MWSFLRLGLKFKENSKLSKSIAFFSKIETGGSSQFRIFLLQALNIRTNERQNVIPEEKNIDEEMKKEEYQIEIKNNMLK